MKDSKTKATKEEHNNLKKFLKDLKTKDGSTKYSDIEINILVGEDETIYTREEYTQRLILEMKNYPKTL